MRRLALASILAATLAPTALRLLPRAAPRPCAPEGRGAPPRGWVGCAGDPGPARDLDGGERLALGLPVDLNAARAEELAAVPGLSPRLAREVVTDRGVRGPFATVDALERVRGIGPARLARARPYLVVGGP